MNHAGEDKYSIKTRNMFSVVGFQELSQFVFSVVEFVPSKGAWVLASHLAHRLFCLACQCRCLGHSNPLIQMYFVWLKCGAVGMGVPPYKLTRLLQWKPLSGAMQDTVFSHLGDICIRGVEHVIHVANKWCYVQTKLGKASLSDCFL